MKKFGLAAALVVAATLVAASPAMAQAKKKQRQRVSPHETIYRGRRRQRASRSSTAAPTPRSPGPRRSARSGAGWSLMTRSGARGPTRPRSSRRAADRDRRPDAPARHLLALHVPAADGSAKLIVNKRTGQWGIPYDEKKEAANELGRVDLKKETLDKPVDQFTMAIEKGPSGGGVIKMMWETTEYSVPFTVKK